MRSVSKVKRKLRCPHALSFSYSDPLALMAGGGGNMGGLYAFFDWLIDWLIDRIRAFIPHWQYS